MGLSRKELADLHFTLMAGRCFSLEALSRAEAQGDLRQQAMTRANLEKADRAINLLEKELVTTQNAN